MAGVADVLTDLEAVLVARRDDRPTGSYTVELLDDPELIQRKVMEEAFEVCLELQRRPGEPERLAAEAADLLYHLLVGLTSAGVPLARVLDVLAGRRR